jgi:hypothetical protein
MFVALDTVYVPVQDLFDVDVMRRAETCTVAGGSWAKEAALDPFNVNAACCTSRH